MSGPHLNFEELRAISAKEVPIDDHIAQCAVCSRLLQKIREAQSQAAEPTGSVPYKCLAINQLIDFAGGIDTPNDDQLLHLSSCENCSEQLRNLQEDLNETYIADLVHLKSSEPSWQRKLAGKLAAYKTPAWKQFFFGARLAWACAAALLLAGFGIVLWNALTITPERLLARAYEKAPLTPLRVRGAHYRESAVTRGAVNSSPSELLRTAAMAREHLERTERDAYWHEVQGKVFLVQGEPEKAAAEFGLALVYNPADPEYRFDLGTAECANAIQHNAAKSFVAGIDDLRQFLQQFPNDNVAIFNLGECLYQAGLLHQAKTEFQRARTLERDSSWKAVIEQRISDIDKKLADGTGHITAPESETVESRDLAAAIQDNRFGRADRALREAIRAESFATATGNRQLRLLSEFEEVYAYQRNEQASKCLQQSRQALADNAIVSMLNLRISFLLEAGICSGLLGDFSVSEVYLNDAAREAAANDDTNQHLRALGMLAGVYNSQGLHLDAETVDLEGLGRAQSRDIDPMRTYQFLSDLFFNAEAEHKFFAAGDFEKEAIHYSEQIDNIPIRASAHEKLAEACAKYEDDSCVNSAMAGARQELDKIDDPNPRALYISDWNIRRAEMDLQAGRNPEAKDALAVVNFDSVRENRSLSIPFKVAESAAALNDHHLQRAERIALSAAEEVTAARAKLPAEQASFAWIKEARPVFEQLVTVRLREDDVRGAFECWESFLSLLRRPQSTVCGKLNLTQLHDTGVLSFARIHNHYFAWLVGPEGLTGMQIAAGSTQVEALSSIFHSLCAQRVSRLEDVDAVGQLLAESLQLKQILKNTGSTQLLIEPGDLNEVPFRALVTGSAPLGLTRPIAFIPGLWAIHWDAPVRSPAWLFLNATEQDLRIGNDSMDITFPGTSTTEQIPNFLAAAKRFDRSTFVYFGGHALRDEIRGAALQLPPALKRCRYLVLAACSTGGSGETGANEFGALPARLLQIGAHAVVASRWDVDSGRTVELMRNFAKALAQNPNFSLALLSADRSMYASGYKHPYYWAGFDVYGGNLN